MEPRTYWLWNGSEVEGPIELAALEQMAAERKVNPSALVMADEAQGWQPFTSIVTKAAQALPDVQPPPFRNFLDAPSHRKDPLSLLDSDSGQFSASKTASK